MEARERFEFVRDLGVGAFGVCKLMMDKVDQELVAVKFLRRGPKVDETVEQEIKVHYGLHHPNVIGFKCIALTPKYLCIVMEYAAGGELFDRVREAGRLCEDEARYFFQQLIRGVEYCHKQGIAHRDIKLENTLIDTSTVPVLKIADFGSCRSEMCMPSSAVSTAYVSPEALGKRPYDGKPADVWSCGVLLYVMLVGAYPFDDPSDPSSPQKATENINNGAWSFPPGVPLSADARDLVTRMLERQPADRITVADIRRHPWFEGSSARCPDSPPCVALYPSSAQTMQEIEAMILAAKRSEGPRILGARCEAR